MCGGPPRTFIVLLVPGKNPNQSLANSKCQGGSQRKGALDKAPSLKQCGVHGCVFFANKGHAGNVKRNLSGEAFSVEALQVLLNPRKTKQPKGKVVFRVCESLPRYLNRQRN